MSGSWPKIIRDPVHDIIPFQNTPCDKRLLRLIETADSSYCFIDDTPGDTAYKPYDPDSDKPATQIYVQTTLGQIKELSTESRTVQQLREPYALLRYYFPESLRSKIDPIARATLNKGGRR